MTEKKQYPLNPKDCGDCRGAMTLILETNLKKDCAADPPDLL